MPSHSILEQCWPDKLTNEELSKWTIVSRTIQRIWVGHQLGRFQREYIDSYYPRIPKGDKMWKIQKGMNVRAGAGNIENTKTLKALERTALDRLVWEIWLQNCFTRTSKWSAIILWIIRTWELSCSPFVCFTIVIIDFFLIFNISLAFRVPPQMSLWMITVDCDIVSLFLWKKRSWMMYCSGLPLFKFPVWSIHLDCWRLLDTVV